MKLLEACDPLFQYVCQLNRLGRGDAPISAEQVRDGIMAALACALARCGESPELRSHYEITEDREGKKGIELALVFFADFMVRESNLPFAAEWDDIAINRYDEFSGDVKFFEMLDEALADRSPGTEEKLAVFYTMLGLGFTGYDEYRERPDLLRRKMLECAARIPWVREDQPRLCPDAYKHTDERPLNLPPTERLAMIGVVLAVLFVMLLGGAAVMYHWSQSELSDALHTITDTLDSSRSPRPSQESSP